MSTSRRFDWQKLKRRLFPRTLSFTREGKVYVFVVLGVGFGAMNTGNNLLFLVFGLMMGLIIVSGILSELTLRGIKITREAPERAEAGLPFPVQLALENEKRATASFGIELKDVIDNIPFRRRCFFLRVGTGEERAIAYRCELERRGLSRFQGIVVSTRFPFGFFEKRRFIEKRDSVIVLPRRVPVEIPMLKSLRGDGWRPSDRAGPGQDFRELVEMTQGDDPRRIDWKATARMNRTMIRRTDEESQGIVDVVLGLSVDATSYDSMETAEDDIAIAASCVRSLIKQGVVVRLLTGGGHVLVAQEVNESIALLDHLALLDIAKESNGSAPVSQGAGAALLVGPRAVGGVGAQRVRRAYTGTEKGGVPSTQSKQQRKSSHARGDQSESVANPSGLE